MGLINWLFGNGSGPDREEEEKDPRCSCGYDRTPADWRAVEEEDVEWNTIHTEETDAAIVVTKEPTLKNRCIDCGETFDAEAYGLSREVVDWKDE